MTGEEKRRFSRIYFHIRARLEVGALHYEFDRIVNLSIGGCLVEVASTAADLEIGQHCVFKILLDRMAPAVEVAGEIVRLQGAEVGIKFTGINPENLFHLQNIIRYNATDPEKIEQEIAEHPGLK